MTAFCSLSFLLLTFSIGLLFNLTNSAVGEKIMRTAKLMKNPWLTVALAVLLILLNPNVSKAALISRDSSTSSSSNGNIAGFIGEEEFLMESGAGVDARLLATKNISYDALQKGPAFPGDKYAIALNKDSRGCQIYDKCRQGE